jgi:glycosyltransferase involved in cell wall biosynthesis
MSEKGDSVVLLARKTLENNTRIFKQAKTLTENGYDVTVIGIRTDFLSKEESKDGYKIIRTGKINPSIKQAKTASKKLVPLYPLYFVVTVLFVYAQASVGFVKNTRGKLSKLERFKNIILYLITTVYYTFRVNRIRWYLKDQFVQFRDELYRRPKIWRARWYIKSRYIRLRTKTEQKYTRFNRKTRWYFKSRYVRKRWYVKSRYIRLRTRVNQQYTRFIRKIILNLRWFILSYNYYKKSFNEVKHRGIEPDIVHANDLNSLLVAILVAQRYDAKLIYDAQELYTEIHTLPKWYKYVLMVQEFILIRFPDKITVVNPFIAKVMEKRYWTSIDEVILNCPPFERIDDAIGITAREKFDIPEDIPLVLYSGGLTRQRGIENVVEAMKSVQEANLVILGEGSLKPTLVDIVEEHGLNDRVFFSDFVPHEEVPIFISSADIGIVPYENVGMNHYLCSPSKLFHYMMAGLVIAGSDFPFLRSVIKDNDIGETFDPDDPESMAAAINAITEDEDRLERHRKNVRQAKYRYTWENEAEKFLAQYEEMHERDRNEPEMVERRTKILE